MKFKEGELYEVLFKDHACGSDEPLLCSVVGFVVHDEPNHVLLSSWVVHTIDPEIFNHNLEKTVILKKCILSKKKFVRIKAKK
jgi:hypothetical protein